MATDTREVILRVSTDANGARKSLADLREELRQNEKAANEARVGSEQYVKAVARVGELRLTIREVGKELKGAGAEGINALGGINENAQFAERSLGELLQIQKQLKKEALGLKPGTDEFARFAAVSERVNARVREVKEQLTGVPPLTKQLGGIRGALDGAVKGFGALKLAIAATGLGAIVQLVTQVVNAFAGFNVVADILERFTAVAQAAFGQVIVALERLAAGDLGGAVSALTGEMVQAALAADALTVAYQDLDDQIRGLTLTESRYNKEIDLAIARARDKTKTDRERLAALDEADKKEKQLLELQRAVAKQELELARQRVTITEQTVKDGERVIDTIIKVDGVRDEYIEKYIAAQKKLDDTERASLVLQEKIAQRRNQILETGTKTANEQAKELDSLTKKLQDLEQSITLERALRKITDEQEKLLVRAQSATEAAIREIEKQVGATEAQILARGKNATDAERTALEVIAKLREQFSLTQEAVEADRAKQREARVRQQEESLAKVRREAQEMTLKDAQNAQDALAQLTSREGRQLTLEQRRELVRRLRDFEKNQGELDELLRLSSEQRREITKAELQIESDARLDAAKIVLGTAQNLNQSLSVIAGENAGAQAALAAFSKQLALVQTAINAGVAVSEAVKSGAGLPFPANLAAIATAVAAVTTLIAQAVSTFSSVEPPAPPRFARGGILRGPSHAQGGIMLGSRGRAFAEAEGGEVVLTKRVSQNPALLAQASAINVAGGGRPLISAPTVSFAAAGGVVPSVSPFDGASDARLVQGIVRALENMPAPEVAVSEITKAQGRVGLKERRAKV